MILLDTNVISEWMKPVPSPAVIAWLDRQQASTLYVSATSQAEIETGIALLPDGNRRGALRTAADVVLGEFESRCLPFDCAVASRYAATLARSKRMGRPIAVEDAQIAAIAQAHELRLATRSITDFNFIDDLELVNPWEE
jgi:predicted nucleic acid-binding protein